MSPTAFAVLASSCAGVAAAVQASISGIFGRRIGVLPATAFSAVVGTSVIVLLAVVTHRGVAGISAGVRQPAWLWLVPGIMGVIVLTTFTFAPPRIGTLATFALLIAGQLAASVLIDSMGLFGVDRFPMTGTRAAGLVLLVAGTLLVLKR